MTVDGSSVERPKLANLKAPAGTQRINGMDIDMRALTAAAEEKYGEIAKGAILSVGCYRNARGVLVPDYSTVRMER